MSGKVLLLEHDAAVASKIRNCLEACSFTFVCSRSGALGLQLSKQDTYDLIIADTALPGISGPEIYAELLKGGIRTPILFLAASSEALLQLNQFLGLGVEDYVLHSCQPIELLSRVRALLRRARQTRKVEIVRADPTTDVRVGPLFLDPIKRDVKVGDRSVDLTALEFDLLIHLARHPGTVFSREDLLAAVWGYSHPGYQNTVITHINRLRRKLEAEPGRPAIVKTVWGSGYRCAEAHELESELRFSSNKASNDS